jgi:multicomponent Na+:H+ antiporter subunit G
MPTFAEWLLLAGSCVVFIAALGLLRLPDALCRSHALSIAMTLGVTLFVIAILAHLGADAVDFKILLIVVFQFTTQPVAGHLLSLVYLEKNYPRWSKATTS